MKIKLLIFCLLVVSLVNASTLGNTVNTNYMRLNPGETGTFRSSFFNIGKDNLQLSFQIQKPDNWAVSLYPGPQISLPGKKTTNNPSGNEGWVYLSRSNKYVPSKTIRAVVKVPKEIKEGVYTIRLNAFSSSGKSSQGVTQKVAQARSLSFKVYVPVGTEEEDETISPNDTLQDLKNLVDIGSESLSPSNPNQTKKVLEDFLGLNKTNKKNKNSIGIGKETENSKDGKNQESNKENKDNSITGKITEQAIGLWPIALLIIITLVMLWIYIKY